MLIAGWSLFILRPFIETLLWAIIMAVALRPLHGRLSGRMGGRDKAAATLFVLAGLALLVIPSWLFLSSTLNEIRELADMLRSSKLKLDPPPASVEGWPVVGESVHSLWSKASTSVAAAISELEPEVKAASKIVLGSAMSLIGTLVKTLAAIIIMGLLLPKAIPARKFADKLAQRIAGDPGPEFVSLATSTIRSVARGVLGVALIQAVLAFAGMRVMGVPGAELLGGAVLVMAIVQLPPILIMAPVAAYVFSTTSSTAAASFFAAYALLVSGSDAVLKPLLLGRGVPVPMLVILLGAIGGMILTGIIGLFVGAVVLALSYQLMMAWVRGSVEAANSHTQT